jgi:hypothetical protein
VALSPALPVLLCCLLTALCTWGSRGRSEFELRILSGTTRTSNCIVQAADIGVPMTFEFSVEKVEHWLLPPRMHGPRDIFFTSTFRPFEEAPAGGEPDTSSPTERLSDQARTIDARAKHTGGGGAVVAEGSPPPPPPHFCFLVRRPLRPFWRPL